MSVLDRLPFRPRLPASAFGWIGAIAAFAGLSILVLGRTGAVPDEIELTPLSGRIVALTVHDLSGAETNGEWFPGLTKLHVRLAGEPGIFVYPAGYPLYFLVRDDLWGVATFWVDRRADTEERTIWGLEAEGQGGAPLVIGYDEIATTLDRINRSAVGTGGGLGLAGLGLLALGRFGRAWNRRLPEPNEASRERWLRRRDRGFAVVLDVVAVFEGLFERGARAFVHVLGPVLGGGLWSLIWVCVYFGGAIAIGVALYGG